ncbi:MAG: DUF2914 domain-containing protein [Nitrospirota bacterium]
MKKISFIIISLLVAGLLNAQEAPSAGSTAVDISVTHALFTSGVTDREPADEITSLSNNVNRIYYFAELEGLQGQTVIHRWEFNGEVKAEVSLNVTSPRWRGWSRKTLDPNWLGEWKVSVVDSSGKTLKESKFSYTKAAKTE